MSEESVLLEKAKASLEKLMNERPELKRPLSESLSREAELERSMASLTELKKSLTEFSQITKPSAESVSLTKSQNSKYALYFWKKEGIELIAESSDKEKLEKIIKWACSHEHFASGRHNPSQYQIFEL
jgi:hypothetical protein